MVQKAMAVLVIGITIAVGGIIYMSITTGANVTGWSAATANMYSNITPLVIFAGFILTIIGGIFVVGHRE
jgi:hypothetical protein